MARHGFPHTTQLSAALTLVAWTQAHGEPPRCRQCTGSGGLLWYTTYYECFGVHTWSAVLSCAFEVAHQASATSRRLKPCHNAPACPRLIQDEGPAIRFCGPCRKRNSLTPEATTGDSPYETPVLTRAQLDRWGLGRKGWIEDLADWSQE